MASKGSVLITGCSDGGLGSAMALVFHSEGYRLNVTTATDIQAAVAEVSEETEGSLTHLINCAARNHFMLLLDENIEDAKKIHDTKLSGPLAVTQALAPLLTKAKGTVVFITSVAGHVLNTPYQGTYATSKISEEIMA